MVHEALCVRCRRVMDSEARCWLAGCDHDRFWRAMRPAERRRWRLARIAGMVAARWVRATVPKA